MIRRAVEMRFGTRSSLFPHNSRRHTPNPRFTRPNSSTHTPPFNPPPISARLRPLIPFFIYWSIITSLAVHLLRTRIRTKEDMDKAQAQISVLKGLIERSQNSAAGLNDDEMQRELEMVGLRERTSLYRPRKSDPTSTVDSEVGNEFKELRNVGWYEVIFGKKRVVSPEDEDRLATEEWAKIVNEVTTPLPAPSLSVPQERVGISKRASSSNVYL